MTCASHPSDPDVGACDVRRANHPECTGWNARTGLYEDWPNEDYIAPKKVDPKAAKGKVREMASAVAGAPRTGPPVSGFPAGEEGSQRAAERWDDTQKEMVDTAIRAVCERHRGGGEFTMDDVWAELNGAVPVTKGITARLMMASRRGLLDTTGKYAVPTRGGQHDHGQGLKVWYSLL